MTLTLWACLTVALSCLGFMFLLWWYGPVCRNCGCRFGLGLDFCPRCYRRGP